MGEVEAGEVELVVGLAMTVEKALQAPALVVAETVPAHRRLTCRRSEEHTSELQSLMRISYAVFCLKKNKLHPAQTVPSVVHHTSAMNRATVHTTAHLHSNTP